MQLGVIGDPVSQSLSPHLHRIFMTELEIPGSYQAYHVSGDSLESTLVSLGTEGVQGLNVTMPHKQAVLKYLRNTDATVQLLGAANTLTWDASQNGWLGANTDGIGFIQSLPPWIVATLDQREVLLLGAGGSAKAVLLALIEAEVPTITVAVRDPEKASQSLASLASVAQAAGVQWQITSLSCLQTLRPYHLVVNTTPVGMHGPDQHGQFNHCLLADRLLDTLSANACVVDLVYRPLLTPFLSACQQRQIETVSGLGMLVYQGAASFSLWSGVDVPEAVCETAYQALSLADSV
ncbi:MAG: shikimate dehydrogenase [Cyanobacteria bacterium]|nr:shikimate dehydrogenase [Cyanobacteriota bacterium]